MQRTLPHTGMTVHKDNTYHGQQQVVPVTSTGARVQWPTPLVPRYGRLRGGVCAQGAEVADEDYKRDDRTKTLWRQVQAPTRDSFGHGTSLARPPEVDLTYPAWYLRSWILYRPLVHNPAGDVRLRIPLLVQSRYLSHLERPQLRKRALALRHSTY